MFNEASNWVLEYFLNRGQFLIGPPPKRVFVNTR